MADQAITVKLIGDDGGERWSRELARGEPERISAIQDSLRIWLNNKDSAFIAWADEGLQTMLVRMDGSLAWTQAITLDAAADAATVLESLQVWIHSSGSVLAWWAHALPGG